MKVKKINTLNHNKFNSTFNFTVRSLSEEIFQTQHIGNIGYQVSTSDNFKDGRYKNVVGQYNNLVNPEIIENDIIPIKLHPEKLGPVEIKLINLLFNSTYTSIVVTGALGCGKTSTSNYIKEYCEKNSSHCDGNKGKSVIIQKINFNSGFIGDYEEIIKEFQISLFEKLRRAIKSVFLNNKLIDKFQTHLINTSNDNWEVHFDDFIGEINTHSDWVKLSISDRTDYLFDWITNRVYGHLPFKIKLLSFLGSFIKQLFKDKTCIIIIYDNIDRFEDEIQGNIMTMILSLAGTSQIKSLINLRLTAFGWIGANAAFSFGHYELAGYLPTKIVSKRLEHYLENSTMSPYFEFRSEIPLKDLDYLDSRIKYISEEIRELDKNRVPLFLEALSGVSIRRALFLSERFILNNACSFKEKKPVRDMLLKSLLTGENEDNVFHSTDILSSNIFIGPKNNNNSLIQLRIMQILNFYKTYGEPILIKDLLYELKKFSNWTPQDILSALQYMINVRKRIIYIDGVGSLINTSDLAKAKNDSINITYTGTLYLKRLIGNLVYVQECFGVINWDNNEVSNTIPMKFHNSIYKKCFHKSVKESILKVENIIPQSVDYSDISSRIKFVRIGLGVFLYSDLIQTINFQSNESNEKCCMESLISSQAILSLAESILNIYYKKKDEFNTNEELLNWLSLIDLCNFFHVELFQSENKQFVELINKYNSAIHKT